MSGFFWKKKPSSTEPERASREETRSENDPGAARGPFLVVGLGNPGLEYLWTPHNAGFMAIDRIAEQEGVVVGNRRCRAVTATCRIAGRETILAKPETFMNLSGLAVAALIDEFEVDPAKDLLVIYDELDLVLGTFKIRERGSPAGHNGARSVTNAPGQSGVAAVANRRRSRFAARSQRGRRQTARQGFPALADAQSGPREAG
jgi:aminoacyl-tRNA hydrolase